MSPSVHDHARSPTGAGAGSDGQHTHAHAHKPATYHGSPTFTLTQGPNAHKFPSRKSSYEERDEDQDVDAVEDDLEVPAYN